MSTEYLAGNSTGANDAGSLTFGGGTAETGAGGDVIIFGGSVAENGTGGRVVLKAGSHDGSSGTEGYVLVEKAGAGVSSSMRFEQGNAGTNYAGLQAPKSVTTSYDLALPAANGTAGQTLTIAADGTSLEFASGVGALGDLSDVTITTPALGETLRYDGAEWINSDASQGAFEFQGAAANYSLRPTGSATNSNSVTSDQSIVTAGNTNSVSGSTSSAIHAGTSNTINPTVGDSNFIAAYNSTIGGTNAAAVGILAADSTTMTVNGDVSSASAAIADKSSTLQGNIRTSAILATDTILFEGTDGVNDITAVSAISSVNSNVWTSAGPVGRSSIIACGNYTASELNQPRLNQTVNSVLMACGEQVRVDGAATEAVVMASTISYVDGDATRAAVIASESCPLTSDGGTGPVNSAMIASYMSTIKDGVQGFIAGSDRARIQENVNSAVILSSRDVNIYGSAYNSIIGSRGCFTGTESENCSIIGVFNGSILGRSQACAIINGSSITVDGTRSATLGGINNTISSSKDSVIIGGSGNTNSIDGVVMIGTVGIDTTSPATSSSGLNKVFIPDLWIQDLTTNNALNEILVWDGTTGDVRVRDLSTIALVSSSAPITGDGSSGDPITVDDGATDSDVLRWDGSNSAWAISQLNMSQLGDVVIGDGTTGIVLAAGQQLEYDGANWINTDMAMVTVNTSAPLTGDGSGGDPVTVDDGATDSDVLRWDGSNSAWAISQLNMSQLGDVVIGDGTTGLVLVSGHQLEYDGANWINVPMASVTVNTSAPLTGDGSGGDPVTVDDGASDSDILRWDGSNSAWAISQLNVSQLGDTLIGDGTNALTSGQKLEWDGANWINTNTPDTIITSSPLTGDGSAATPATVIDGITAKVQHLRWGGSSWNTTLSVYDAVVAGADADYITVKAAVDAGRTRIAVVGDVTDTAQIALSADTYIRIFPGVTHTMTAAADGAYSIDGTSTFSQFTIEGEGEIDWNPGAVSRTFVLDSGNNVDLTMKGLKFTNSSSFANTQVTTTCNRQIYEGVTLTAGNADNAGVYVPDIGSQPSIISNCSIVGGGTGCEGIIDGNASSTVGWNIDNSSLTGDVAGGTFVELIILRDNTIMNNFKVDIASTGIVEALTIQGDRCVISNVTAKSSFVQGLYLEIHGTDNILTNVNIDMVSAFYNTLVLQNNADRNIIQSCTMNRIDIEGEHNQVVGCRVGLIMRLLTVSSVGNLISSCHCEEITLSSDTSNNMVNSNITNLSITDSGTGNIKTGNLEI